MNDLIATVGVMLIAGMVTLATLLFRARTRKSLPSDMKAAQDRAKAQAQLEASQEVTDAEIHTKPTDRPDPSVVAKLERIRARYRNRVRTKP